MAQYRTSRNIEATLIEFIEAQLTAGSWTNISVEKGFARVYGLAIGGDSKKAVICVRMEDTEHPHVQIGDNSTVPERLVFVDIFASSDGQRLDLKDFLVDALRNGCVYYEFVTKTTARGSSVDTRTADGRLRILKINDTSINFGTDKTKLDIHDRFRHLLVLTISRGQVEN